MRPSLPPAGLAALLLAAATPLRAQWDLRLEVPRPSGQSLPQTLLSGTGQLASGSLDTGRGVIASAYRQLFQIGPLFHVQAGLEYSQWKADGTLAQGSALQGTALQQKGGGVGLNALLWVPFIGVAGEIGAIQRFQRYTLDTPGLSNREDLSRTWLRVGLRWRLPLPLLHPYLAASYQEPITKDHPVQLHSASDLAAYFQAQGSGQEFERMWTFGVGVAF